MKNTPIGVHDGVHDVQDALDWLDELKKLKELIAAKEAEQEEMWAEITRLSGNMDGMPRGSGVSDKTGRYAIKLAQIKEATDAAWDKYIDRRAYMLCVLERLPALEYGVLHREYIREMTQEQIAMDMNYSTMQIWRIKQKALVLLQNML